MIRFSFLEDEHRSQKTQAPPRFLGPLYFLIHINDIPSSVSKSQSHFADDTVVYLTINFSTDSKSLQHANLGERNEHGI